MYYIRMYLCIIYVRMYYGRYICTYAHTHTYIGMYTFCTVTLVKSTQYVQAHLLTYALYTYVHMFVYYASTYVCTYVRT